jgi:hypothetical protein
VASRCHEKETNVIQKVTAGEFKVRTVYAFAGGGRRSKRNAIPAVVLASQRD